ncbi:nucleotide exchange factor GrpE [Cyanobacterium sp. IPPAS B-1200]|uniref:nucleotide exchange factor GrpE n=1 Tax=Cyanobacterium sp. IPPAS B-1200 TaxID=1562720 RepID=UPI0008528BB3|nr:nucleotide exchange factor GrpE [Cyanobacterium sp. IPPAS B-1200]OEJ79300.1 nucleotide exchange factor GrpE [Cyanobacterium sp. IPPAS B-1200]
MTETNNYMELDQEIKEQENIEENQNIDSVMEPEVLEDDSDGVTDDEAQDDSVTSETTDDIESEDTSDIGDDESESVKAIALLQEEIANLHQQLELQKEQTKSVQGQFMRLTADFDNFRRRTAKEKEEQETTIKKKTITELLPVVDNFERARTQIKPANDGEMGIHKSYQGVYKTFVESLKKLGVSAMRPEGELFDPNYQEAMLREPTNEYPEGTVIEQLVRGYLLNDQVLRYAMVKVAAPKDDDDNEAIATPENGENAEN